MNKPTPPSKTITIKKIHYAFTFIYAVITTLLIIIASFWRHNISTFRMGMMGYFHVLTGILLGILFSGNILSKVTKSEFKLVKSSMIPVIIVSIISILFTLMYLYDLGDVLITVCPESESTLKKSIETLHSKYQKLGNNNNNNNKKNIIFDRSEQGNKDGFTSINKHLFVDIVNKNNICEQEKPFAIVICVILVLIIILHIITTGFYIKMLKK